MRLCLKLLTLLTVLLLAACSPQPLPKKPTPIPTLIPATMPAQAPSSQTAPAGTHPGSAIFDANCSACHTLTEETKVGPGLAGLFGRAALPNGNPVNDENLKGWIRTGGGAMPGLPLSDSDLDTLVEFLTQALGETEAEGSDGLGQEVFQANCSVCHNLNAETKVGPGLAGLFDRAELPNGNPVSDENLKTWIENGGGAMPGVPLPENELEALIVYLENATK
jgi:mono/diheme cytochrome c family protein